MKRKKEPVYGTPFSTAKVGTQKGVVFGVFYRGGERHIAKYIPYKTPPDYTLCGLRAGVSTRTVTKESLCLICQKIVTRELGKWKFS